MENQNLLLKSEIQICPCIQVICLSWGAFADGVSGGVPPFVEMEEGVERIWGPLPVSKYEFY